MNPLIVISGSAEFELDNPQFDAARFKTIYVGEAGVILLGNIPMDDEASCRICGRPLTKDERGLNQKILEADAKRGFWRCLACLAEYLECGEEELREKVEEFKAEGCKLFG